MRNDTFTPQLCRKLQNPSRCAETVKSHCGRDMPFWLVSVGPTHCGSTRRRGWGASQASHPAVVSLGWGDPLSTLGHKTRFWATVWPDAVGPLRDTIETWLACLLSSFPAAGETGESVGSLPEIGETPTYSSPPSLWTINYDGVRRRTGWNWQKKDIITTKGGSDSWRYRGQG